MSKITRPKLYAEVEFRQLAVGADEDASFSATGADAISQTTALSNGEVLAMNYARLETGGWVLDGSIDVLEDAITEHIGLLSSNLSSENLTLSTLQVTAEFSSVISSAGLTIYFDSAQGGYAPEFVIKTYNGVTLVDTFNVTADNYIFSMDDAMDSYDKVVVEINKWNLPGARARITQILFGNVRVFGNSEMVEFSVLNQVNPVNETNATGELVFAFDNRDGKYDFENPIGIFDYITTRQAAYPRIGFESELIPLGVYYLSEWKTEQGKATFKALDALSLLDQNMATTYYSTKTLTYIATDILTKAGIAEYVLESSLDDITVSTTISNKKYIDTLKDIAIAARLTLHCNRGVLTIGELPSTVNDYTINWTNSAKPKSELSEPIKSITVGYGTETVSDTYNDNGREISITENGFIKTVDVASAVLAWLEDYYLRRKVYKNSWRQNPMIECGDVIKIQGAYGTVNAQVERQQMSYSGGGLTGQTDSRVV